MPHMYPPVLPQLEPWGQAQAAYAHALQRKHLKAHRGQQQPDLRVPGSKLMDCKLAGHQQQ